MPASLWGGDPTAIFLAILMALAVAFVASCLGRWLAAWLAVTCRGVRWVGWALALGAVMPPVVSSLALLTAIPPELLDSRPLRLAALLGVAGLLAVPLVALVAYGDLVAAWARHGRMLRSAGAGRWQAMRLLLRIARPAGAFAYGVAMLRVFAELSALLLLADRFDPAVRALPAALLGQGAAATPDVLALLGLRLLGTGVFIAVALAAGARIPGFARARP